MMDRPQNVPVIVLRDLWLRPTFARMSPQLNAREKWMAGFLSSRPRLRVNKELICCL